LKQEQAVIISNKEVMPDTFLLWLEAPSTAPLAEPGQFIMVRCGDGTEMPLRRPISIHQRKGNQLALLYAVVGKGTAWLSYRKKDESIDIIGPLGNSFTIDPASKNLLMVGGGVGIAPMVFLTDEAVAREKIVQLVMGASSKVHLAPKETTHSLLTDGVLPVRQFYITMATDDGSEGYKGLATELIPDYIDWADQVFACGPLPMYRALTRQSQQFPKLKSAQISLEVRMGCGTGICYGCTVRTKSGLKQVCKDGPVFRLDDIDWEQLGI